MRLRPCKIKLFIEATFVIVGEVKNRSDSSGLLRSKKAFMRKEFLLALTLQEVAEAIEQAHRDLATQLVDQSRGILSAVNTADILEAHPIPLRPKTIGFLRKSAKAQAGPDGEERVRRLLFGCIDLIIEEQTATLNDMVRFYFERGRMIVDSEKIPALDVVPWLQSEKSFEKREEMLKEHSIFMKGIINPMLLGILELTIKTVIQYGYQNFADYCQAKKGISFSARAAEFEEYLETTRDVYSELMAPWVIEEIGRPFENLSRCHALYLLRIRKWDQFFPVDSLLDKLGSTFRGLGFDIPSNEEVVVEMSANSPGCMCVGVNIPGEVYVLLKPTGGLIDMESLLHEAGHAFFLANFDPDLPIEYRRLYGSTALDETFAFLFMGLLENPNWIETIGQAPKAEIPEMARRYKTKRLCLIRRYMGKFLAEKELHDKQEIKKPEHYCRRLEQATGFVYEPQGYLIDMESNFYSLDYLDAWAGADILKTFLEVRFGGSWFTKPEAGEFLKNIAFNGRRLSLATVLEKYCGEPLRFSPFDPA